jgi:hypothetical protein
LPDARPESAEGTAASPSWRHPFVQGASLRRWSRLTPTAPVRWGVLQAGYEGCCVEGTNITCFKPLVGRSLSNRRSLAQLAPDNHAHHPVEDGVGHGTLVPPTRDTAEAAGGPNSTCSPNRSRPGPQPRRVRVWDSSRVPARIEAGRHQIAMSRFSRRVRRHRPPARPPGSQADTPTAHMAPVPVSATTPPRHPIGIGPPPATPNRDARNSTMIPSRPEDASHDLHESARPVSRRGSGRDLVIAAAGRLLRPQLQLHQHTRANTPDTGWSDPHCAESRMALATAGPTQMCLTASLHRKLHSCGFSLAGQASGAMT